MRTEMDKKGFEQYLQQKYPKERTQKNYFSLAKSFDNWLRKRKKDIDTADEGDIRNYLLYLQKKVWTPSKPAGQFGFILHKPSQ
jgi:site-specific recombinase XerD